MLYRNRISQESSKQQKREEELSRDDLIHLEGMVTRMLGGGTMEIECDKGVKITAVLSGRMKKNKIKVIIGDRVQVSVSPYDTRHGLITYRL